MPNMHDDVQERRVRAAFHTRACAAGLCVGAQLFLAGCAVGMPLALSSAWLAALPALPLAAWLTLRSRLALLHPKARAGYGVLCAAMLACAAFALLSITGFAGQTLCEQSSALWIETAALIGVLLCAVPGAAGAARLCYALRYALPALALGLSMIHLPMRVPVGLFPLLGAGPRALGLAALSMLFGAAPALMLSLLPQELAGLDRAKIAVPDARFFLVRVLAGALAGVILLFLTSACTTYESIEQSSEWSARLRMAAGNQPHEGIAQMALILSKLMAMLLLAANMLCAAQQALGLALPRLSGRLWGLLFCGAALAAVLLARIFLGDAPMLAAAPTITLAAVLAAAWSGREQRA